MTTYCLHGQAPCTGNPTTNLAPCLPTEHHYCSHGYDTRRATSDGQPRCPHCRGVTRAHANPDTYRRRRDNTHQPALSTPTAAPERSTTTSTPSPAG